jgi:polyferredoxin/NAD-dependent dihydropyrimidine dehydrogenase PreA subunit
MPDKAAQKNPQRLLAQEIVREPIDKPAAQRPVGRVFMVPERCKECKYCWEYCPEEVLEPSQAVNSHGYHYPQVKNGKESACVVCGMCEWICPDFAIYAVEARSVNGIASRIRAIRWASQLGFLAFFLVLATGAVCTVVLGRGFAVAEPFGVLQLVFGQMLVGRSLSFVTTTIAIGIAIFVGTTALLGRAFCAWACPVGTVIDAIDSALERLRFKPFFTRHNPFAGVSNSNGLIRNGMSKYAVLGSALAGSAMLGTPVWCAFCPIGALCRGAIAGPELAIGAEILTVPAVGAMSLGEKRFWCKYLCPVGAFLTLLSKYNVFIKPRMRNRRQLNCGLCTTICPEGINLCQEKSYARCTKCLDCYTKCPSGAVKIDLT